jgi:hypothetical protein
VTSVLVDRRGAAYAAAGTRALIVGGWIVGVGFTLYGAASTVEKALMKAGAIAVPADLGEDRVGWYLFLWDPFWLMGGLLLVAATIAFARAGYAPGKPPLDAP